MLCDLAYLVQVEVAVYAQRHQVRQALTGEVLFGDAQLLVTEGAFVDSWTGERSHTCVYGWFLHRQEEDRHLFTQNAHEHSRFFGGDLLQEGQDLIQDEPLVQILQDLTQTHQRVHSDLQGKGSETCEHKPKITVPYDRIKEGEKGDSQRARRSVGRQI